MIVQRFYCLPSGQFYGGWSGDAQTDHDPLAAIELVEVPFAPDSTDYFWDADSQSFHLPGSARIERQWRDGELTAFAWMRERHRDQVELGVDTSLSAGQFSALLSYLQQLRDWPQASRFPEQAMRPVAPEFLQQQRSEA